MRCHHGGGLEACGGGEREIPGLEHGDPAPLAAELGLYDMVVFWLDQHREKSAG